MGGEHVGSADRGTCTGARLTGELRSVGRDVLALQLDGGDKATSYMPVAAVVEVTITH